jgi:hypothetical protein
MTALPEPDPAATPAWPQRARRWITHRLLRWIARQESSYFTFHQRPRRANAIHTLRTTGPLPQRCAIVVQGPLATDDDFTLNTLALYRRHHPDVVLILSTWEGQDAAALARARDLGAQVVTSQKPAVTGTQNINLQIVSSHRGIERAAELGTQYVLKTRSDQRMYSPLSMPLLLDLCLRFALPSHVRGQSARLVACSLNTFKYRLYGVSDMLMFGHIDDMKRYWHPPLDERPPGTPAPAPGSPAPGTPAAPGTPGTPVAIPSLRQFAELRICETYLCTEFLKALGRPLQWTLRDSMRVLADHFCVVDQEALDLYWPKYEPLVEYRRRRYDHETTDRPMSFADWLLLEQTLAHLPAQAEAILDLPLDHVIAERLTARPAGGTDGSRERREPARGNGTP